METTEFSLKELYSFRLKATYPMKVAGTIIEPGEVIADFDEIQIANFQEVKSHIAARGGKYNEAQVVWNTTKELNIDFAQGVFSKTQLAIMHNSKYLEPVTIPHELIGERENVETNDEGKVWLKFIPHCDVYVYDEFTGIKFPRKEDATQPFYWQWNGGKEIQIIDEQNGLVEGRRLIIDYCFLYKDKTSTLRVGKEFTNGFLWAEGKTKVQDDKTGKIKTGIIRIPKLKLMSDLSIRVGEQANPLVGHFKATAYPTGNQGDKEVMRLIFLEDDIDSDI